MSFLPKHLFDNIKSELIQPIDFRFEDGIWSFLGKQKMNMFLAFLSDVFGFVLGFCGPFLVGLFLTSQNYNYLYGLIGLALFDDLCFFALGHRRALVLDSSMLSMTVGGQKVLMNLPNQKLTTLSSGEAIKQIERGSNAVGTVIRSLVKSFFRVGLGVVLLLISTFWLNFWLGMMVLGWVVFNFVCSYLITSYANANFRKPINEYQTKEKKSLIENITQLQFIKSVYFTDIKLEKAIEISTITRQNEYKYWQVWRVLIAGFYIFSILFMGLIMHSSIGILGWNAGLLGGVILNLLKQQMESYEFGLVILEYQKTYRDLKEYFDYMVGLNKEI
jgi:ABC-type multidrug transport system fused ATPase/permease subunit